MDPDITKIVLESVELPPDDVDDDSLECVDRSRALDIGFSKAVFFGSFSLVSEDVSEEDLEALASGWLFRSLSSSAIFRGVEDKWVFVP